MSTPNADSLMLDFQHNGVRSALGQLFLRLCVIKPIEELYADAKIDSIRVRFHDGQMTTVRGDELTRLLEAPDQVLEDRIDRVEQHTVESPE